MKIKINKVKKNKVKQWNSWCFSLTNINKKEALGTLKKEELTYEGGFGFYVGKDYYTLGLMSNDGKSSDKRIKINKEHQKMKKECFENSVLVEELYFFNL